MEPIKSKPFPSDLDFEKLKKFMEDRQKEQK